MSRKLLAERGIEVTYETIVMGHRFGTGNRSDLRSRGLGHTRDGPSGRDVRLSEASGVSMARRRHEAKFRLA